jgi:hypothetical protein
MSALNLWYAFFSIPSMFGWTQLTSPSLSQAQSTASCTCSVLDYIRYAAYRQRELSRACCIPSQRSIYPISSSSRQLSTKHDIFNGIYNLKTLRLRINASFAGIGKNLNNSDNYGGEGLSYHPSTYSSKSHTPAPSVRPLILLIKAQPSPPSSSSLSLLGIRPSSNASSKATRRMSFSVGSIHFAAIGRHTLQFIVFTIFIRLGIQKM